MKRVIVKYDEVTGQITDARNMVVGNWMGLEPFQSEDGNNVRDLIKLKEAGFTAEDIVALKDGGVL